MTKKASKKAKSTRKKEQDSATEPKKLKNPKNTTKKEVQQDTTEDGQGGIIEEIRIEEENKTIPIGFTLSGLKRHNTVVGENGSGKTNLFEAIEKKYRENDNVLVVYVRASEVNLADYGKTTADSSGLVKQLADILKLANTETEVDRNAVTIIKKVCDGTNDSFKDLSGEEGVSIEVGEGGNIKYEWIVRSVLSSVKGKDGNKKVEKLEDLAQGHQRLLIASFLKSCADIIQENSNDTDKKKQAIILFEEPEIYMHPKLKAQLKEALEEISKEFQVIISTHDPYFIPSKKSEKKKIIPLCKNNNITEIEPDDKISGIVNEILHINLYAQLTKGEISSIKDFPRKYWDENKKKEYMPYSKCIRNQIHHPENPETDGLVWDRKSAKKNYYTPEELEESIHQMRQKLAERKTKGTA